MGGLSLQFVTRSVVFGGVLCVPGAKGRDALTQLLQRYIREADRATLFTELRNLTDMSAIQQLLKKYGFVYHDYVNFLINLKGPLKAGRQKNGSGSLKSLHMECYSKSGMRRKLYYSYSQNLPSII